MEKYWFDVVGKKLTVSAAFAKKMADIESEEFARYQELNVAFSGLELVRKTHKSPRKYTTKSGEEFACNPYKNLTDANMKRFISSLSDSKKYLAEYEFIKKYASTIQTNPYALMRKWFVAQFPEYRKNPLFYLNNTPFLLSGKEIIQNETVRKEDTEQKDDIPKEKAS